MAVFSSRGLITQPQIEQFMNLTAMAVALAVWEIRAMEQQIGTIVTSVKQGQIYAAKEGQNSILLIGDDCVGSRPVLVLASWRSTHVQQNI